MLRTLTFSLLTLLPSYLMACDVCGTPAAGSNYSLINIDQLKFLQFKTSYSQFNHLEGTVDNDGFSVLSDVIVRHTLQGSMPMNDHWTAQVEIPFVQTFRQTSGPTSLVQGMGDFKIQFQWQHVLLSTDTLKRVVRVSPFIALPTGTYMQRGTDKTILPIWLQPGTGAWSTGVSGAFIQKAKFIGISAQGALQVFGENERSYHPGERASGQIGIFYDRTIKQMAVVPQLALQFDTFGKDLQYSAPITYTGGHRWSTQLGIGLAKKQWALQGFIQLPLEQTIPEEQPRAQPYGFLSLSYFFKE